LVADCSNIEPSTGATRLDKWLWAVRIFKSRALATDAIHAGSVEIDNRPVKPARAVRAGETITVRQGLICRTLRVVATPRSRVSAKLVPDFCTDLTPASEFEKVRTQRMQQVLAREKGSGRPTKRERRTMDRLMGGDASGSGG
jgi:ribosome-associated heat shock protein Hsp15